MRTTFDEQYLDIAIATIEEDFQDVIHDRLNPDDFLIDEPEGEYNHHAMHLEYQKQRRLFLIEMFYIASVSDD